MSCYEAHRGVLKKVDTDNIRQYLFSLTNNKTAFDEDYDINEFIYNNSLESKYIVINNCLYEWLEHECKYDEEDNFCDLKENQDKTISIHAQFYNGGTCLNEVLNDEWNKLIESKELSASQIINIACLWLGYHQSNYIISLERGDIVSGACQTDLRAFLNKVKNIDYYEALKLTKQ